MADTQQKSRIEFPTLNPDKMPASLQYWIAKRLYRAIRDYFCQPGVKERFEAWKAEREAAAQQATQEGAES